MLNIPFELDGNLILMLAKYHTVMNVLSKLEETNPERAKTVAAGVADTLHDLSELILFQICNTIHSNPIYQSACEQVVDTLTAEAEKRGLAAINKEALH